jgi:hypothetical protein
MPQAQILEAWGKKTLKWLFDQWIELRREEKTEKVIHAGGFDLWLESRTERERKNAQKMVKALVSDDRLETASALPLLEIIKTSIETSAFQDLLDELDDKPVTVARLLHLFDEWRIIEAREHLRLADGRLNATTQLRAFMSDGALEVTELQPLLVNNLWLLDEAWTSVQVEENFSALLRRYAKEAKAVKGKERRLDIFGVNETAVATIVELKHPQKTLSREDLEQVSNYVDWARTKLIGTGEGTVQAVRGRLLVGSMGTNAVLRPQIERLRRDGIYVETFGEMYSRAIKYYSHLEQRLESIAPEYSRRRRLKEKARSGSNSNGEMKKVGKGKKVGKKVGKGKKVGGKKHTKTGK